MFSIYSEPICDIARKRSIKIHSYADKAQLYLSFDVFNEVSESLNIMEQCVGEIREWTRENMLKLNYEKTNVFVISSPLFIHRLHETHVRIGDASFQVWLSSSVLMYSEIGCAYTGLQHSATLRIC